MALAELVQHSEVHALYSSHHAWLQGWLRHKLGNAWEAADLAQDTFISVLSGGAAAPIREPRPFLATVARRLVAHRHRRQVLEEAYLAALAALPQSLAPSPEERLLALEALQQIDAALDGLVPPVREAFLLAQLEGLSYAEIAARLNVSASSVKQYLTRANRHCFFALPA
ncbi:sigma-70 family RNA polymerase sigma factor [Janthinobacterium fluminis]|uniref:Sigma-70 family RNA polymerase sigma factor n=1 Tax=Janthinobacterium fluminis TaxID=2987524 RepID=A0ABT5K177_9BURK|nr:sigma-70 family RNA polymerase sigma factor [Janthinobacterium fluminis]MDC8758705.1 sigma-70 family RNA polymerase sigma factor [Janthinobacterium fluminis]